jgi:outer membrane receptor for ferrienterochelin and colicins
MLADFIYEGEANRSHSIVSGFEIRNERFSRSASPEKQTTIAGAFLKDEVKLGSKMTYITAIRMDHHPNVGTEFTPKFGALYRLTLDTDLRTSIGKGFRAPSLQDLYEKEFDHKTYYRSGNADLKPEYSLNYNLSVEHRFNDYFLTRVSTFKNTFRDMIMILDTGYSLNNKPILRRENVKQALAQGVESEVRLKIGELNVMLSYTFSDTKDDNGDPLAYSPKHMTVFRLYYYLNKLTLGTMISFEDARERIYKLSSDGNGKLSDYTLVNASINKKIRRNFIMFIRVENMFNQKFEIYEDGKSLAGYGRSFLGGIKFEIL